MRPKILVCALCGTQRDWVNPILTLNLACMMRDPRFDVAYQPVCDYRPFEYARNKTIALARDMAADWLISFDADNFLEVNPLDIIAAAGEQQDIIGLTYGIGRAPECMYFPAPGRGDIDGPFQEVPHIGGGVLMVRSTVWQKVPRGPWFRWQHGDDELLAPAEDGCDEVRHFANLARQHGFRLWTHRTVYAGHFKTSDCTKIVDTLDQLSGGAWSRPQ